MGQHSVFNNDKAALATCCFYPIWIYSLNALLGNAAFHTGWSMTAACPPSLVSRDNSNDSFGGEGEKVFSLPCCLFFFFRPGGENKKGE